MSEEEKKKPNKEDIKRGDIFLLSLLLLLIGAVMFLTMTPDASDFYVFIIKACATLGGGRVLLTLFIFISSDIVFLPNRLTSSYPLPRKLSPSPFSVELCPKAGV